MEKRNAEQAKADAVRGEAAFNRGNQTGWAAGVSNGTIPANASPVFMESYKRTEGNFKGIKMRESFSQAYTMWDGRDSDDPEAFQTFLSDFIASNVDTDDVEVLAGFNPHVELLTEQAYQTHTAERSKTVYNGHVNTRAAIIGDTIDHASIQGVSEGEGTDYGLVMEDILQQRDEALASGIRMEDFDKELAATIASKAIEHGDPYLLELLDQQLPGYDVKFSSLPAYRDLKATTVAALEVEARRQMTQQTAIDKAADEEAEGKIVSTVFQHLSETPLVAVPEDVIKAWERYDPEARKKLADARRTFMDENTLEDPADLMLVERMIQDGAGPRDILDLVASGVIRNPTTFRTMLDRAEKRQSVGNDVLGSQTARRFTTTIKERTTPDDVGAMFAPDGLTDEGLEATKDFEGMVIDWVLANPEATIYDREKFIYEAGELVLKRIDRDSDSADPQYISETDAQQMRAEEAATQKGLVEELSTLAQDISSPPPPPALPAQGSAVDITPAATAGREFGAQVIRPNYAETTQNLYGGDSPPDLNTMDEASRSTLEKRAEGMGLTLEEYNTEIWKTVREGMGLSTDYTPPAPITVGPTSQGPLPGAKSPEAASTALSYFQANPTAVRLDPSKIRDHTPKTSGNWNFGKLTRPSALVVHHTAGRGGVEGVIQTFKDRNFPAHFVIDREGTIHRILADDQKGQHTRPAQDGSDISNSNSWGVEVIANDDSDLTPEQVQASVQLAHYLHDNYQMPLDRVVGHGQINDHKQETEGATVLAVLANLGAAGGGSPTLSAPSQPGNTTENLLAFISDEEGTRQDYNVTHGYGKYTGGDVELTSMSINQVLELQGTMKANGSSGAAGKYQVLPGTLRDAMAALRLDGSEPYDQRTQDAIAMWLLQRRGLEDWQSGKLSTSDFVDNLSKEWASLAGSSGKANYPGQGENASLDGLLAALGQPT